MKTIIILLFLISQPALSSERFSLGSVNQIINGCSQGQDLICKTIRVGKVSVENAVKSNINAAVLSPSIVAFKVLADKGVRIKSPIFQNDNLLIQTNKITYGFNISF